MMNDERVGSAGVFIVHGGCLGIEIFIHHFALIMELGGCSSAGRAPALHAGGHRFEPVHLHQDFEGCVVD